MGALAVFAVLAQSTAFAGGQKGIVVRVHFEGDKPAGDVVVHLTAGAEKADVAVTDDGKSPDLAAGDGTSAGSVWLDADTVTVGVTAGGKDLTGGDVSWNATDVMRDLSISIEGENVTATAGVPTGALGIVAGGTAPATGAPVTPPLGAVTGGGGAVTGGGGAVTGGGGAPGAAPPTTGGDPSTTGGDRTSASPSASTTPPLLSPSAFVTFGIFALVLAGAGWMFVRSKQGGRAGEWLEPEAEAGLLGPGSPSPSAGLSIWTCGEADLNALADALLATLARHHRVLVVTQGSWVPPAVHGGPVWRAKDARPRVVGATLDAFLDDYGQRPVLLVVAPTDAQQTAAIADALPPGIGGVVVTAIASAEFSALVTATRSSAGWRFTSGETEIVARIDDAGLWVVAPARA